MLRKPRIQSKLAPLTTADKELLADWLRQDDYEQVLARVKKPREEGGFGLTDISKGPLQTFYAKVALLDVINSKLSSDKRMTIAKFESISNGDLLLASTESQSARANREPGTDNRVSDEVHDAIMDTTYDLATSGDNTPTDLLALQRLADFPARAEYRAHKMALDFCKETRQSENDAHRKHMSQEYLALSQRALDFRERMGSARVPRADSGVAPEFPRSMRLDDELGSTEMTEENIHPNPHLSVTPAFMPVTIPEQRPQPFQRFPLHCTAKPKKK